MNKIVLDINDDVVAALEKIRQIDGASIEVEIPEGSIVLDNITNLKLLERKASDFNKSLHFHTTDPVGKTLISILNDEEEEDAGYLTKRVDLQDHYESESSIGSTKRFGFIPSLPNPFSYLHFPSLGKLKIIIPFFVFLMLIGGVGAYFINSKPSANVTIVVNSQPLIKSFPIHVSATGSTSESTKTLNGDTKSATVTQTASIETTGETQEGEKAKGDVTLYNKTDEEIELKKGAKLKYDSDPKDLVYKLLSDVSVPARTELPPDPDEPTIIKSKAGEKSVSIEAEAFGSAYNIDEDEKLTVDEYDDDEIYAQASEDIDGGSSKTVKVVAKEDVEKLKADMTPKILEKSEVALKEKETSNEKFITGSVETNLVTAQYSHKEGEKTEKLELTQTAESKGLFYSQTELFALVEKLVDKFIPDGFKLSSQERDVKAEILGDSDSSVLSATDADLQITLKTYVVPNIDEETLKNELAGKSLKDAQQQLSGIRNVKTYGINLENAIALPLFQKIPTSTENIKLEIQLSE
jgi:hypothetical protein